MPRIGIVGVGFMGMVHYLSYQSIPGVEVVAICDSNPKRLAGDWTDIKGNFGPPGEQMDLSGVSVCESAAELIAQDDIDLVDITLPPAMHADVTIEALAAGKHVFCEKPMAMTVEDCDRMLDAAKRHDRKLLIGHVLPFFPEYAWALQEINSCQHGRLLGGSFKRVISDPAWLANYWDAAQMGGPMLDLHVHDAHFIRLAFGMPSNVITRGAMRNELPEHWHSLMEFKKLGVTVHATSGVIYQPTRPFLHGFEVQLERATLAFEFAVNESPDGARYHCPPTLYDDQGAQHVELGDGDPMRAFCAELEHVVSVLNGVAPAGPLSGELARDAILLCRQQAESLSGGV